MTNIKMWPKSSRPIIKPPEITSMLGRPSKNRRKHNDEPSKKNFGKAARKGRKMKCSLCKTFGHNKKGCPILKIDFNAGNVTAGICESASNQSSVNAPAVGPNPDTSATDPTAATSAAGPSTAVLTAGPSTVVSTAGPSDTSGTQQSTSTGQKRKEYHSFERWFNS